jgi:hypothetical protein
MKYDHDKRPKPGRVKEPVQVYLSLTDRDRLDRLTKQLDASKSDVLREALGALERELADPEQHPALRIIGIAGDPSTWPPKPDPGYDVALEHDRFLAETEIASWERQSEEDET